MKEKLTIALLNEAEDGSMGSNEVYTMTRSKAIEKMAKAIFTQIWGLPNNRFDLAKSSVQVRNRKLAEAALNSLLEGHDDER